MPGLNKREMTSKPLRLDSRMARDIEKLSALTGYSQNDIILMALRRYLFENREYFLHDMIDEMCISLIEKEVGLKKGEINLKYGGLRVDVSKSEGVEGDINSYSFCVTLTNNQGIKFYENHQVVDMSGSQWDRYKEFLYDTIIKYVDINEPALKTYFREKFLYE
ncbi:MAG: hypothetical protein J6A82_01160 [Coprococcus sp.]|nr:hypothetical protein [Coprococcus sp.]